MTSRTAVGSTAARRGGAAAAAWPTPGYAGDPAARGRQGGGAGARRGAPKALVDSESAPSTKMPLFKDDVKQSGTTSELKDASEAVSVCVSLTAAEPAPHSSAS